MRADFSELIFIILFLAFSIISSLMSEKKKKQQKKQDSQKPAPKIRPLRKKSFQTEVKPKDIFDLIFSGSEMRKQREPELEKYAPLPEEVDTGDNAAIDDSMLRSKNAAEKRKFEMEQAMHSRMKHPSDKLTYYETVEPTKMAVQSPKIVQPYPNKKVMDLRNKLYNYNSLKDFIVISEIIGKPKALRR